MQNAFIFKPELEFFKNNTTIYLHEFEHNTNTNIFITIVYKLQLFAKKIFFKSSKLVLLKKITFSLRFKGLKFIEKVFFFCKYVLVLL